LKNRKKKEGLLKQKIRDWRHEIEHGTPKEEGLLISDFRFLFSVLYLLSITSLSIA